MGERPVFYLKLNQPCKAGGVIFYQIRNNRVELLLIKHNGLYEDFGGKTDNIDRTIKDTIIREVVEESNSVFTRFEVRDKIRGRGLYLPQAKYLLYLVPLEKEVNSEDFGNKEIGLDIDRTVEFVPYDKINYKLLHMRLRNNKFISFLNKFCSLLCIIHEFSNIDIS